MNIANINMRSGFSVYSETTNVKQISIENGIMVFNISHSNKVFNFQYIDINKYSVDKIKIGRWKIKKLK